MVFSTRIFALVCSAASVLSCSSEGPPSPSGPAAAGTGDTPACQERQSAARRQVQEAIDSNRQCTTDADCTSVAFATLCFDSCTRAVSSRGVAAVQQAIQQANTTYCASYRQEGCPFVSPPCAPPRPSTCRQGLCEM